jgi:hypothetical protein
MKNPIVKAREEMGLTIREFALLCGTVEVTVRTNESADGIKITPKILNFLESQGYNRAAIQKEYQAFREWKVKQISKRIKAASH